MVVGPRYIPGTAAIPGVPGTGWGVNMPEVPDAARITPPVRHPSAGPINPVTLSVDLDAGFRLRRLESPFHRIVGIGASPNSHFMTKAAQFGRGTYTSIGSPAEVGAKMGARFRKLEHPVLSEVRVTGRRDGHAWEAGLRLPASDEETGIPQLLLGEVSEGAPFPISGPLR